MPAADFVIATGERHGSTDNGESLAAGMRPAIADDFRSDCRSLGENVRSAGIATAMKLIAYR